LLFDEFSLKSLEQAIGKFDQRHWSAKACRHQAKNFAAEKFQQQLLTTINKQLLTQSHRKVKSSSP
jgi:hypothetical protein